ncbi:ArdC-like ssDNA-binding domain-containing protein [Leifsonia sp. SIMBA_070]|uniref:ArdC-like ssDNA-binding domain-containing protein n=1 Tax=Leifsonia sp. SIMBA_070 TaxID=3085810 RepID=UPI00397DFC38
MSTTAAHRAGLSADEQKARAETLHNSISEQVEQLNDSEKWRAFLEFAAAFHAYSLNNLLLILAQRPDATQVAGFRKWQKLGRQVRKGETGIRIFGYSTKKITEEDDKGEEFERRIVRYPILTVFDIRQTDPIDGAEDPSSITQQLTGADDHGVIGALTNYLLAEGWSIHYRPLPGSRNGYTDPDSQAVVLDDRLSREHAAKTLIHETAHILLGHTSDPLDYVSHRGRMEVEAESVAYIVAGLLGCDTAVYSIGYITGWANGDTNLIQATAARVLAATHRLATITQSAAAA